jgi:hypothetical protein
MPRACFWEGAKQRATQAGTVPKTRCIVTAETCIALLTINACSLIVALTPRSWQIRVEVTAGRGKPYRVRPSWLPAHDEMAGKGTHIT